MLSQMVTKMVAHSPLLGLQIVALALFAAVFVGVLIVAMTKKVDECASAAALPLFSEESSDEP